MKRDLPECIKLKHTLGQLDKRLSTPRKRAPLIGIGKNTININKTAATTNTGMGHRTRTRNRTRTGTTARSKWIWEQQTLHCTSHNNRIPCSSRGNPQSQPEPLSTLGISAVSLPPSHRSLCAIQFDCRSMSRR